jgi:hypothetical protein
MARKPLFEGLIVDEYDQPVKVAYVGNEPCYVVNDAGFLRHIPSEVVDRQVLQQMREAIAGHEDFISEQTAKMLGQDDIFTRAMIEKQLMQIESQFETLMEVGLPDEVRAYMGMMGFRIVIDIHGNVIEVQQPGGIDENDQ